MGTTLSLTFRCFATKFSNFAPKNNPPYPATASARRGSAGIRILYTYDIRIQNPYTSSDVRMIIGVMRLSYNKRPVPDGRFRHHLFRAVFMRVTYPQNLCILGGQGSTQLSRPLLLLPLVCENAVKAGSSFKPLKLVRFKHP